MASRTLNFDNFMSEKKQEPIKVTVFGEQYDVKPEIPAIVMVTLARSDEATVSEFEATKMIINAGDIMFGKPVIDRFCRKGMRAEQLVELIKSVFDMINGKDVDGEEPEELDDESGMVTAGKKAKK